MEYWNIGMTECWNNGLTKNGVRSCILTFFGIHIWRQEKAQGAGQRSAAIKKAKRRAETEVLQCCSVAVMQ